MGDPSDPRDSDQYFGGDVDEILDLLDTGTNLSPSQVDVLRSELQRLRKERDEALDEIAYKWFQQWKFLHARHRTLVEAAREVVEDMRDYEGIDTTPSIETLQVWSHRLRSALDRPESDEGDWEEPGYQRKAYPSSALEASAAHGDEPGGGGEGDSGAVVAKYRDALERIANWKSDGVSWRYDFARVCDIAANALRSDRPAPDEDEGDGDAT